MTEYVHEILESRYLVYIAFGNNTYHNHLPEYVEQLGKVIYTL